MTPEALEMRKKYAARVMKLEKEVAATQGELLKTRIINSAMVKQCEEAEANLAAAQATNERLREALKFYMVPPIGQLNDHCVAAAKLGMAALALPNDTTALQARLQEERERCAIHLETLVYQGELSISEVSAAIYAIRSMT